MLAAMTRPEPVDLSHLSRYTGGERGLNVEILKLFDLQLSEMVDTLTQVMDQRDTKRWREITHTIKGAARGVGAFAAGEAAAAAEPVDPLLQHDKAKAAVENLRTQRDIIQSFLRDYLG
jgi:HPt (histidine-containing phosphotransfer) domain-containing protein